MFILGACPHCKEGMNWRVNQLYIRDFLVTGIGKYKSVVELEPDMSGNAQASCRWCGWCYDGEINCGKISVAWALPIEFESNRGIWVGKKYLYKGETMTRED